MTDLSQPTVVNGPAINVLLTEVSRHIGNIGKNHQNKSQGFNFRGIDDALNELGPVFHAFGVGIGSEVLDCKTESIFSKDKTGNDRVTYRTLLQVRWTFIAPDGSSRVVEMPGEGQDFGDKATYKAISGSFKYACFIGLCIPVKPGVMAEPDADSEPEPQRQMAQAFVEKPAPRQQEPLEAAAVKTFEATEDYLTQETYDQLMKLMEGTKMSMENRDKGVLAFSKNRTSDPSMLAESEAAALTSAILQKIAKKKAEAAAKATAQ